MLTVDFLSLFPEYFESPLNTSILQRALKAGLLSTRMINIRDFSTDKWKRVDAPPAGGGVGMVMQAEPLTKAIESVRQSHSKVIYLSPQGSPFTAAKARELAKADHLIFCCGHYEGIDQRVIDQHIDEEISIGDYVLTNGALAALVVLDAVVRFVPGVLGDSKSADQDSFESGIFDHPHYTKPNDFRGQPIPEILRSGDHQKMDQWRKQKALEKTYHRRPELFFQDLVKKEDRKKTESDTLTLFIGVADLKTSLRFYQKCLTFQQVYKGIERATLEKEGITIALREGAQFTDYQHSPLVLGGVLLDEKKYQILKKNKAHYFQDLWTWSDETQLLISDPDGYIWRVKLKL